MPQFGFGSGSLFGVTSDTVPQAVKFGTLQEVNIEISFSTKELTGQYQFPVAVGRGKSKISCKAKYGMIEYDTYASLFFGLPAATGQVKTAVDEAGSVPAQSTYTVTVANSATWATDLGVTYAATGLPLARVATVTAVGQYSVAAGVYTFYSTDASAKVLISYTYTAAAAGKLITLTNQLLGLSPNFKVVLNNQFQGKDFTLTLNRCVSSKLTLPTKLEDFLIQDFDFEAMADDTNTIGTISVAAS